MSETNCMTCMIGRFKDSLCEDRLCKKYARDGSSEDFEKFLLDKDLVVVVRCRDCKHGEGHTELWCEVHEIRVDIDYFCADGERREDGE